MKKQFHKIKIAAENLSRSNRTENKNDELLKVEKQVEKYKDVLEKIHKKFSPSSAGSEQDKEKRIKKIHEFRLGQSLEESSKELPTDLILHDVLMKCGDLEKTIANYIVEYEIQTENELTKKLKNILDSDIQEISTHKRTVSRYLTEYNSIKKAHENAQRSNENQIKINQLKLDQEECELKLEKERDCWAAQMFDLIAKDEIIAYSIRDYVRNQKNYYEKSIRHMETVLIDIDKIVNTCQKKRVFGVSLQEHLNSTSRDISSVIELCCCCLIERGLNEEGLLRVGCAGTKLKRMKNAIDAQYVNAPLSPEYQDIHVIASILKLYLRELPEPLLTYNLYQEFILSAQRLTELERKNGIKLAINKLPKENYTNLKYLIKFLWCLCQREEYNKMSAQNIAIVMSPNILWPPETMANSQNYECQVTSSTAVNTIVALLINEWDYFFDNINSDFEFYITLNKDGLFIDTQSNNNSAGYLGGNGDNCGHILTESISQQQQFTVLQQQQQHEQLSTAKEQKLINQTHSRSNSNDTSRIFLGSIDNSAIENVGRSHSNDSLSDTSPSYTGSPKLPARRKHNKPSAPTPPHAITNHKMMSSSSIGHSNNDNNQQQQQQNINNNYQSKHLNYEQIGNHLPATPSQKSSSDLPQKCDGTSQTPPLISSASTGASGGGEKNKPDKPPRPTGPVECYTLNRSTYKNRSIDKIPPKPTALPRTILNITKSTENLSMTATTNNDDHNSMANSIVKLREKPEIREKPIIPERPVTIMRPTSFRADNQYQQDFFKQPQQQQQQHNNDTTTNSGTTSNIKKASSFRMMNSSGSPSNSNAQNNNSIGNNNTRIINSNLANSTSSLCSNISFTNPTTTTTTTNSALSAAAIASSTHNHKTKLERAQFFNVDKKQVAIIDFVTTAANSGESMNNLITTTTKTTTSTNPSVKNLDNTILTSSLPTDNSLISFTNDFISNESTPQLGAINSGAYNYNNTGIIGGSGHQKTSTTPTNQVPISPRGFNQNIKRPQVPAPAPPTNRRKSDGTLGDSTHL